MERSQRQLRVAEQLRHVMTETMRRGSFGDEILFHYAPKISISEVRVSPDLKNATAFVSLLGEGDLDEVLPALNEEHQEFQKDIGQKLRLKFTPRVHFKYDESIERVSRLDAILSNLPKSKDD